MGTHPIFESDFDCLTEKKLKNTKKEKINGGRKKTKSNDVLNGQKDVKINERDYVTHQGRLLCGRSGHAVLG